MKNYIIEIKWAVIFSGASLLWIVIEKMTGLHDQNIANQQAYSLIFALPAIVIFALALRDKKKNALNGTMQWKEGVISGIILSLFIAVLSPVVQWIGYTVISPQFFPNAVKHFTDSHILTEAKAMEIFNLPAYMKKGITEALSMGVITSALVALFVKSKTPK